MRAKRYESVERIRARFAPDPTRDLLTMVSEEMAAATSPGEKQAIFNAAAEVAPDPSALNQLVAGYSAPAQVPNPYRTRDRATGRLISADDAAELNPDFAKVVAAVRAADTAAEAFQCITAAVVSGVEWSEAECWLIESLREEVVDDGTVPAEVPSHHDVAADLVAHGVEPETPTTFDLFNRLIGDAVAAAEAADAEGVTA